MEDNSEEKIKQAGKAVANKVEQKAKSTGNKLLKKAGNAALKLLKAHLLKIMIIIAIVAIIIILLASFVRFIKIDDGSYQEGKWNNTSYVVSEKVTKIVDTSNITGNESSGYTLGIDLDAKVDEVLKSLQAGADNNDFDGDLTNTSYDGSGDGTRLAAYLSDKNRKEYLKDFIKAEIVTQYPDLRKNPDAELSDDELQGVIKIKRAKTDGNTQTLRYVDEDTFNSYVELYNDKQDTKAINYFTLNSSGDLVVAKWNKTTTKLELNSGGDSSPDTKDPSTDEEYNVGTQVKYTMTTTSINYKSMVEQYTMPFDFIWALLVMTEDEEFAHDVSKLALNSKIEFTVYDNKTTTKTVDVYKYKKQNKTEKTANFTIEATVGSNITTKTSQRKGSKEEYPISYKVTKTVTEEDVNPVVDLTYANTWIAEYKITFSEKIEDEKVEEKDPVKKDDIDYQKTGDKKLTSGSNSQDEMLSDSFVRESLEEAISDMKSNKGNEIIRSEIEQSLNNKITEKNDGSEKFNIANTVIGQLRDKIINAIMNNTLNSEFTTWNINNRIDSIKGNNKEIKTQEVFNLIKEIVNAVNGIDRQATINNNVQGTVDEVTYVYYRRTTNQEVKTTVTTKKSYTQGTSRITEKTDKGAKEDNFVTLFLKSNKAQNCLKSAPDWFFEMLENSPTASDMIDITKYLLYKATGKSYGVEEFDFSEYDPSKMSSVGNGNVIITGESVEENVWNALVSAGFSEIATAGVMGNIYQESHFNTNAQENGNPNSGYGLCQWTGGRRTNYEAYAASKEKDRSDLETQIEFLLGDLGVEGYVTELNENVRGMPGLYSTSFEGWENATSVKDAVYQYCWTFERPAVAYANMETRYKYAESYYETFKGKKPVQQNSTNSGNATGVAKIIIDAAESKLGCPYVWGADGPNEFDCSGFTMWCYAQAGISIQVRTDQDIGATVITDMSQAKPGDILHKTGHVVICVSNENGVIKYIHAPQTGDVVKYGETSVTNCRFTEIYRRF